MKHIKTQKIAVGPIDVYETDYLLDYRYFKEKLAEITLRKQQALDSNP